MAFEEPLANGGLHQPSQQQVSSSHGGPLLRSHSAMLAYQAPPVVLGGPAGLEPQPTSNQGSQHHTTVHGGSLFFSPSLTKPQGPNSPAMVVARSGSGWAPADAHITLQPRYAPLPTDSRMHGTTNALKQHTDEGQLHTNPLSPSSAAPPVPPATSLYASTPAGQPTSSDAGSLSESTSMLGPNENSSHHHHPRHYNGSAHHPHNNKQHMNGGLGMEWTNGRGGSRHGRSPSPQLIPGPTASSSSLHHRHADGSSHRARATPQHASMAGDIRTSKQQQAALDNMIIITGGTGGGDMARHSSVHSGKLSHHDDGGEPPRTSHGGVVVLSVQPSKDQPFGHAAHSARAWLWDYARKWRGVPGQGPAPRESLCHLLWGWLGSWCSIAAIAALNQYLSPTTTVPVLVASFGASAVLLFGVPDAKLAQPRNFMGGHFFSALTGIVVRNIIFPDNLVWLSAAVGMATALLVMQVTKTTHPPGGATALIASSAVTVGAWHGFRFLVTILWGSSIMLLVALLVNNISGDRRYPIFWY